MKLALAVTATGDYPIQNTRDMCACVREAAENGAGLILFPETALTGPVNINSVVHDLMLGVPQDSELLLPLREDAEAGRIAVCFGYFELFGGRMYDSVLCYGPDGRPAANYRRQSFEWRDPHIRGVYAEGTEPGRFDSPLGRAALLIGGDITDDSLLDGAAAEKPDFLLLPMARRTYGWRDNPGSIAAGEAYLASRAKRAGVPMYAVNCLGGDFFGGAWAFGPDGTPLSRLEPGRPGLLYCELPAGGEQG